MQPHLTFQRKSEAKHIQLNLDFVQLINHGLISKI